MTPITWIAGGLAAVVAGIAILIKGGMAERPGARAGMGSSAGGPAGSMIAADEGSVGGGIPLPTQTVTGHLGNGEGWGDNSFSEPAVTYSSAGDGTGGDFVLPSEIPGHGHEGLAGGGVPVTTVPAPHTGVAGSPVPAPPDQHSGVGGLIPGGWGH